MSLGRFVVALSFSCLALGDRVVTHPDFSTLADVCPNIAFGTLVVGCKSAEDLKNKAWITLIGKSSPYCLVAIIDPEEGRKTEPFKTNHKNNNLSPIWNEVFGFRISCPKVPESYALEISVMGSNSLRADDPLGSITIPLQELTSQRISGELTYDLPTQGKVTLRLRFCPNNDPVCITEAQHGLEVGGGGKHAGLDCDQSCQKDLPHETGFLEQEVKQIESELWSATLAGGMKMLADVMEDHHKEQEDKADDAGDDWEDRGDYARSWEDHREAKRMENHYDQLEDHHEEQAEQWGDMGDDAKAGQKGHRKNAAALFKNLPVQLMKASGEACGDHVANLVQSQVEQFVHGKPEECNDCFQNIKSSMEAIGEQVKSWWWEGFMLPSKGAGLTHECFAALRR